MAEELVMIADIIRGTTYAMTPLVLATVGEIVTERAGIVNIGLEGIQCCYQPSWQLS